MSAPNLESLCWPSIQLPQALTEVVRRAGLCQEALELPPPGKAEGGAWIEWAARRAGCEAEPLEMPLRDLAQELAIAKPALLRISDAQYLAVLDANARRLVVLTPGLERRNIALARVCIAIREPFEQSVREPLEQMLAETGMDPAARKRPLALLLDEQIGHKRWRQCWLLRLPPGGKTVPLLRDAGTLQNGAALIAAHTIQYLLWMASWAVIGRLSFEGHMDRGWLLAWALLLMTLLPFQIVTTWLQGLFTIGLGGILKRRLLCGALKLAPEEMRHAGIGTFLGQAPSRRKACRGWRSAEAFPACSLLSNLLSPWRCLGRSRSRWPRRSRRR